MPSVVATVSATSLALSGGRSSTWTRPPAISTAWSCQFLFHVLQRDCRTSQLLGVNPFDLRQPGIGIGGLINQANNLRIRRHHLAVMMVRAHLLAIDQMGS